MHGNREIRLHRKIAKNREMSERDQERKENERGKSQN